MSPYPFNNPVFFGTKIHILLLLTIIYLQILADDMLSGIQRYIMSGGRLGSQTYNICRPGYFQLTNIIRTFVEYNKYYQPQKSNGRTI